MALKYRITKRKDNIGPEGQEYYIMQAIGTGEIDIKRLSYLISNECTVKRPDVVAVLTALGDKMKELLADGHVINLENIGRFKMGFKSTPQPSPELLRPHEIKKFHINYQPTPEMKNWLKGKSIDVVKEPRKR
ncbi:MULTISPECIES: HU family DNA-binding protein [Aequorivita]|jgi:predicted histone-like DNA-binding protein|uniref:HU domain-containing protein n=1 Tax=Aequorivita vladivostokensis TaxID=171194 RepID=A0ABR5DJU7_9FLAO|nr:MULTISPECIES: hypothetical protein [Aequorivita]KJJ39056.1 hypothetical protein MB09_06435 [Aequorivita vladivostokensis]MDC8001396.1 DNA-binding protein [Aequorivita todarodis]